MLQAVESVGIVWGCPEEWGGGGAVGRRWEGGVGGGGGRILSSGVRGLWMAETASEGGRGWELHQFTTSSRQRATGEPPNSHQKANRPPKSHQKATKEPPELAVGHQFAIYKPDWHSFSFLKWFFRQNWQLTCKVEENLCKVKISVKVEKSVVAVRNSGHLCSCGNQ